MKLFLRKIWSGEHCPSLLEEYRELARSWGFPLNLPYVEAVFVQGMRLLSQSSQMVERT